jgi:16S rRNA (cytosine1402-N4)-methyltransferase
MIESERRRREARDFRWRRSRLDTFDMTRAHVPVLAGELMEALDPAPGQTAVDCTFGAGGHARLVAQRLGAGGEIVCIDRDPHAEEHFNDLASDVACATRFIAGNYADVLPELHGEGLAADLLYMDLGISSMQVDTWERGFSYSYDAPLDMRMDSSQDLDARAVLNEWPEARLAATLREYGEERYARRIAREIVRRRDRAPIETTTELVDAIKRAVPTPAQFAGGHPARRTFQAIRIAVNDELGSLERALPAAWELLRPGGRMAVIAFHSLEDRLVKRFFADLARGCICPPELPVCVCGHEPEAELVTRRAVRPSEGEVADNPRSEAGRLRAAIKLDAGPRTPGPERSGS